MQESSNTVEVAVPLPLEGGFHYLVPDQLKDSVRPGVRVFVPFGRRRISGYVLRFGAPPVDAKLKAVISVLDQEPLWTDNELAFFRWIADYYLHPLGEVLKAALPSGINLESRKKDDVEVIRGGKNIRTERVFFLADIRPELKLRGKNEKILEFVSEAGKASAAELRARFGECSANLKKLVEQGALNLEAREVYRDPFAGLKVERDEPRRLNVAQQSALEQIVGAAESGQFAPFMLYGVTGSGKTEVYLQGISHCMTKGQNALVLVPEISLTPQLVHRFRARFGDCIAVLHSALSDGERYDQWRRIRRGEVRIVIGARSAIFAPLERIGIIVVDEEHEASFKQSEGLRYNARDLSLVRGQQEGAVVVLGSATPLVTSWHAAESGKLRLLTLPERVEGRPLPVTEPVPVKATAENPLSDRLIAAISENLEKQEQSLLFINRRGFATWLSCSDCGAPLECPNCSVSLTYHRQRGASLCHYCDYQVPAPGVCPACGGTELKELGAGTERVEYELKQRFPDARIARMDSDTTAGKGGHARILDKVGRGEVDILIGTQMVAKGHDFPGVTLVGVLQAEGSLYLPDFRAAERTFQVLSQVIGRAGRGELPGRVLLQAANPGHYALEKAIGHDFAGFCAEELSFREELGYPPFGHLVSLQFSGTSENAVRGFAEKAGRLLRDMKARLGVRVDILGPANAPLYRLRGRFRFQILLKSGQRSELRRLVSIYRRERQLPANVRENLDIDPVDML